WGSLSVGSFAMPPAAALPGKVQQACQPRNGRHFGTFTRFFAANCWILRTADGVLPGFRQQCATQPIPSNTKRNIQIKFDYF
ncbi:MAG TPA: hypothetical protein VER09_14860, partial [Pseudomonas sp.]|nr:hypothetical protein [Pseudomonas sp.]